MSRRPERPLVALILIVALVLLGGLDGIHA